MAASGKPSVTQIKRLSKEELFDLAEKYDLSLESGLSVRQMRDVLISALWSDDEEEARWLSG